MAEFEIVNGDTLFSSRKGPLKDQIVVTVGKVLRIPGEIREQMRVLDEWVSTHTYNYEIGGFGLTSNTEHSVDVIEFVYPDPKKIFQIPGLFNIPDRNLLQKMLSDCQILTLHGSGKEVFLRATGIDGDTNSLFFGNQDGQADWYSLRQDLARLFDHDLPEKLEGVRDLNALETYIDLDGISMHTSFLNTKSFMRNIAVKAKEAGLKVGYAMHYHPNMPHVAKALSVADESERRYYYQDLLTYSLADFLIAKVRGEDFFEIRSLGTPEHPCDPSFGTTSRIYRTASIH